MTGKRLRLSGRLMAVAGFIENGSDVADVGADHGYLPVYLAQNGLARRIIASDISPRSHKSAMNSAAIYSVSDRIKFIAAPGLAGIGESEVDTIVMAGMGGETITGILADAPWTKNRGIKIIMQPQTKTDRLCSWLLDNGYALRSAALVRDKGRIYVVIVAKAREFGIRNSEFGISGNKAGINEAAIAYLDGELSLLSLLAEKNDPLFCDYIGELISKARRAAEGMARSGAPGHADAIERLDMLVGIRDAKLEMLRSLG